MEHATISQVKNSLSAYLRKVRAGETIIIKDRDQPIAKIEPIAQEESEDSIRARLIREGIIRPAKKKLTSEMRRSLTRRAETRESSGILEALLAERAEGR